MKEKNIQVKKLLDPLNPDKYLRYLGLPSLFGTRRTKEILSVNPTIIPQREDSQEIRITVHEYNGDKAGDT